MNGVSVTPEEKARLVTVSQDCTARVWDLETGHCDLTVTNVAEDGRPSVLYAVACVGGMTGSAAVAAVASPVAGGGGGGGAGGAAVVQ